VIVCSLVTVYSLVTVCVLVTVCSLLFPSVPSFIQILDSVSVKSERTKGIRRTRSRGHMFGPVVCLRGGHLRHIAAAAARPLQPGAQHHGHDPHRRCQGPPGPHESAGPLREREEERRETESLAIHESAGPLRPVVYQHDVLVSLHYAAVHAASTTSSSLVLGSLGSLSSLVLRSLSCAPLEGVVVDAVACVHRRVCIAGHQCVCAHA
jgi:hypothetical protein